ncbi:uncharacterized protein LOC142150776 [Mixophyes fleayi]|uniref:uncharacterized protein LOC142150776 n=1 Tax=Mixophyes fleayi TaxID=3061075 RepID=UPI003F4E309F
MPAHAAAVKCTTSKGGIIVDEMDPEPNPKEAEESQTYVSQLVRGDLCTDVSLYFGVNDLTIVVHATAIVPGRTEQNRQKYSEHGANESLLQLLTLCTLAQSQFRRRKAKFMAQQKKTRCLYMRRRRAFLRASIASILRFSAASNRTLRARERSHGEAFWSTVETFEEQQWMQHFRMSRGTFNYVLDLITPAFSRKATNFGKPIPPCRRLSIVLWWYATPGEYRTISCLFGVGISTVCTLVHEVTTALLEALYHRFISLPQGQCLDDTIAGFLKRGFPQCAGAIDGTHIPIIAPTDNHADYYNRKGWHSIILQAVVDHNYCFTDVFIGWPGRSHDARVLANSDLYQIAEERQDGWLFPREKSTFVDGVEIPVHIIGDAAYPLRRWLMKGFTQQHHLSQEQIRFSHTLSSARMSSVNNILGAHYLLLCSVLSTVQGLDQQLLLSELKSWRRLSTVECDKFSFSSPLSKEHLMKRF